MNVSTILKSIVGFLTDRSTDASTISQMIESAIPDRIADPKSSAKKSIVEVGSAKKYKDLIHAGLNLSGIKTNIPPEPKVQSLNKFVGFTEKKAKELCKAGHAHHLSEMVRRSGIFLNIKDPSVEENRNLMNYMVDNECLPLSTNTFIELFSTSILKLYTSACKRAISNMNRFDELVKEISKRPNTVDELNQLIELKQKIANLIVYETYPNIVLSYYKKRDQTNYLKMLEIMSTHNGINTMLASRQNLKGGAPKMSTGTLSNIDLQGVVAKLADRKPSKVAKAPPNGPIPIDAKMFGLYNIIDGLLVVLDNYSSRNKKDEYAKPFNTKTDHGKPFNIKNGQ